MNRDLIIRTLSRGSVLAARVPPIRADACAWVAIFPMQVNSLVAEEYLRRFKLDAPLEGDFLYHVRVIELAESVFAEADQRWLWEGDVTSRHDVTVVGEEALWKELDRIGVSSDALDLDWKVDYPL